MAITLPPSPVSETYANAMIAALQLQRDTALHQVVNLAGELAQANEALQVSQSEAETLRTRNDELRTRASDLESSINALTVELATKRLPPNPPPVPVPTPSAPVKRGGKSRS